MRALAYETRRLRGLRSSWLVLTAVLLGDGAVAALLTRQLPAGELSGHAALRVLTAAVPLLPLPIAAFGAGALGALSYGHEVRHPGLAASRVAYLSRVRLLVGKLAVIGAVAALLSLATVLLNAAVLRVALRPGVDPAQALGAAALRETARPLLLYVGLAVVAGWTGLLITSLVRSTVAGMLILGALPVLLEPALAVLLRTAGPDWQRRLGDLPPFRYGLDWAVGASQDSAAAQAWQIFAVGLAVATLLAVAAGLAQLRRRGC